MRRGQERPISVLVVDDDPQVSAYLCSAIGNLELAHARGTEVRAASDLATTRAELQARDADLVVLDLDLPDSGGIDTVVEVVTLTGAAVVVVTGSIAADQVEQIVLAGAHDCLIKGEFDGRELARNLRINLARHRRVAEVVSDLVTQRDVLSEAVEERESAETADAGQRVDAVPTSLIGEEDPGLRSAKMGMISLADSFPDQVAEMTAAYAELVLHRLEERGLHVDYQVTTRSRKLSWDLGRLRARPRDLVDIHLAAVADLTHEKAAARRAAVSRAAESLLVETMGHLTTYYRTQRLGSAVAAAKGVPASRSEKTSV